MIPLVVGLDHRNAPVELLGKATVPRGELSVVLAELLVGAEVAEVVVLSTCNRVEIVAATAGFHGALDHIGSWLAARTDTDLGALAECLHVHYADDAVRHLFTVAAGLGSMVLGEAQILGQVRDAYLAADAHGSVGRVLHELFQQALRVGKRIHTDTDIDQAGRSVVTAALELGRPVIGGLVGRSALIIGTGSMGALAGATLRRAGVGELALVGRTPERAARLAETLAATTVDRTGLADALAATDLVISATASTTIVLDARAVAEAQRRRNHRPLLVLDLAVPRDVADEVRHVPGVTLVDVESLGAALAAADRGGEVLTGDGVTRRGQVTQRGPMTRQGSASALLGGAGVGDAYVILVEETQSFLGRQRQTGVAPTVVALRAKAEEVVAAELDRLATRLPDLDPLIRAELARSVRRVVSTLLHLPTVRVKELAGEPGGDRYALALRALFDLDVIGTGEGGAR